MAAERLPASRPWKKAMEPLDEFWLKSWFQRTPPAIFMYFANEEAGVFLEALEGVGPGLEGGIIRQFEDGGIGIAGIEGRIARRDGPNVRVCRAVGKGQEGRVPVKPERPHGGRGSGPADGHAMGVLG